MVGMDDQAMLGRAVQGRRAVEWKLALGVGCHESLGYQGAYTPVQGSLGFSGA
jgi:hypothetical protein